MLPSNEKDRTKISNAIKEISNAKTMIESQNDLIKEIVSNVSEEFDIPKRLITKLANTYHKGTFNDELNKNSEFEEAYEILLKG